MPELVFSIQGSAKTPYAVRIIRENNGELSASCSCPAGERGMHCKHRVGILEGNTKGIVNPNKDEVSMAHSWFSGTQIETALNVLRELESLERQTKKKIAQAKRDLASAMGG